MSSGPIVFFPVQKEPYRDRHISDTRLTLGPLNASLGEMSMLPTGKKARCSASTVDETPSKVPVFPTQAPLLQRVLSSL